MQTFDLIIRNGKAILPAQGEQAVDIAVRDGKIAALLSPGTAVDASQTLDAKGLIVMPGAIDVHLHLGHGKDISRPRVPEDAAQETAAAVSGGVTAFIPYLMATEEFGTIFDGVRDVTEAGSRIDFGYHFIISTEEQLAGVPRYASEYGAPSFKIFMNNRGGEGARLGLPDIDDGFLLRLCESAAKSGGMVCPHPETIELAWVLRKRAQEADPKGTGGLATWNASRPPFVEADAVQRAAYVAGTANCPLYVVHTSSAEALDAALRLRGHGRTVHVETCPHYLTHDVSWSGGDVGKINPPLRESSDREALWEGIRNGSVDTVATDHVHRDASSKAGGIWAASPGCPGLDTLLPIMLSEGHHKRGIPLSRITELVATNPARIMGMGHAKGAIAVGLDADFAIIDVNGKTEISNATSLSSAKYSIYDGWKLNGRVVHTLVRGAFAMRDGKLDDACVGRGRYIKRRLAS
jgi:dihydropyrimidinase